MAIKQEKLLLNTDFGNETLYFCMQKLMDLTEATLNFNFLFSFETVWN